MATWDEEPVPERNWFIRDRIPIRQPVLLSGEGSVGKSLIVLHLLAATALGRDWLGMLPEPGGAWYLGAEDEQRELHIRLEAIRKHFGVSYTDLIEGDFRMKSLFGEDAVLGAPNRHGIVGPTALFDQLLEEAADTKPKLIGLDASADVFAGDEINRSQVRQFVGLLRKLAGATDGVVILLSHPSLTGISSGTGLSGSTAWHNSVRARMYLTSPKPESGEQPDTDLRELAFKKNQYGPLSEPIILRYRNGLYLPEAGTSNLDKLAAEQQTEEVFLSLLTQFTRQGRNVSHTKTAPTYAPAEFVKDPAAKGIRKEALADAMSHLFAAGKIHVESYGRPSRRYSKLVTGPPPEAQA
jgi:RecA-family ATPase